MSVQGANSASKAGALALLFVLQFLCLPPCRLLFEASLIWLAKLACTFAGAFSCFGFRASRLLRTCPLAIHGDPLFIEIKVPGARRGDKATGRHRFPACDSQEAVIISRLRLVTVLAFCLSFYSLLSQNRGPVRPHWFQLPSAMTADRAFSKNGSLVIRRSLFD